MPKPNYAFAKRQRELEKKRKKEEKSLKKDAPPEPAAPPAVGSETGDPGATDSEMK